AKAIPSERRREIVDIEEIPEDLRNLYRTVWELPQKALIDMAAARGPFIDQSQSLNLFMAQPNIGKLSSMYMYAWKAGLKTTYYLRSRPATRINQATAVATAAARPLIEMRPAAPDAHAHAHADEADALACSLENLEYCEACQ
ncbi:MAG: ribonucleoside-diphosphate reductase subunit alpha, partial [Chloroflexota bacterium]|nr:ribonucleoside-diphosphate reductase subunit alpha [Chloroflexota bacterium]